MMPVQFIELTHDRNEIAFLRIPIPPDARFSVEYTHSVSRTPVQEVYRVLPDRRLLLIETVFTSYGAGHPEQAHNGFEVTDKGFRIYGINQPFDFLVYRTASQHSEAAVTLVVENKEYPFLLFSEERTPVRITIKSDPVWLYWIQEGSEWLMKGNTPMN